MDKASELHRTGRLAEAEAAYRGLLAAQPDNPAALLALGQLRAQQGSLAEGLNLAERALQLDPALALAHFTSGSILAGMGRKKEALARFDAALSLQPALADAHFARGCVLFELGRIEEAAQAFASAAAAAPANIEFLLNYGSMLQELKRFDEALAACNQALALSPGHPGALNNRGNTLRLMGRLEEALADFDRVLTHEPDYAMALFNRATVLLALERNEEALKDAERLVSSASGHAPAHHLHGLALSALARHGEALAAFERALALQPAMTEARHGRIRALVATARWGEALAECDLILSRDAKSAIAHNNRGVALRKLARYTDSVASFDLAVALQPDLAEAWFNRSGPLYELGRLEEAYADTGKALALKHDYPEAASFHFCLAAHLCDWQDRARRLETLQAYCLQGRDVEVFALLNSVDDPELHLKAATGSAPSPNRRLTTVCAAARRRLRIAYLSPDFRDHPVAYQAVELFEHHDGERFETYAISLFAGPPSAVRSRLQKAFHHFVEAQDPSDSEVAGRIARLQIDILVDLGGYTDKSRPPVLSWRPAPLIAGYLGYPGTMGARYVDYIIADGCIIPPENERYYAEKVARFAGRYMPCDTKTIPSAPPARASQGLADGAFVFCAFNKSDKITPEVFDIWMRLLHSVPGSLLWLNVGIPKARENLIAEAGRRGVEPGRLIFAGRVADRADHLARLALADLFLDTFPYNAHATASDFLGAGVPVLTCMGKSFVSRVAASMLKSAGAEELIARDLKDYEEIALQLAREPHRLEALRGKIASGRKLHDMAGYTRQLESIYEIMWDRQVRGLPPESFTVS